MSKTLVRSSLSVRPRTDAVGTSHAATGANSWFSVGTALFIIILTMVGFGASAVDTARRNGPPNGLVIAHVLTASAWLLLFLGQTVLVATRRTAMHRRFGRVGPVLTLVMAYLIVSVGFDEARRGYDFSGDISRGAFPPDAPLTLDERVQLSAIGMLAPLLATFNFVLLVSAALWYRQRPEIHGRLMLLSLLSMGLVPLIHLGGHAIGHWPSLFGAITAAVPIAGNALLFVVAARDWIVRRHIHPVSLWVPIAMIVEFGLVVDLVTPTSAWRQAAEWLLGTRP